MKLLKIEKLWLIFAVGLFIVFNIPGVPPQGNPQAAILWCAVGMVISWVAHFSINAKINKIYKPRKTTEEFLAENAEMDRIAHEKALAEIEAEKEKRAR